MRGLLGEGREADSDRPAVRLRRALARAHCVEIDHASCSGDAGRVVAAVVVLAGDVGIGHRARRHEVLRPHVRRLATHRPRDRVDGEFHREAHPGACDAAVRREARLVGRDGEGLAAVDVEGVWPRQVAPGLGRFEAGGEWPHRVRTHVHRDFHVDCEEAPALVGEGGHSVVMLAGVGACGEMLAPILDPAQRPAGAHRRPRHRDLLGLEHALVAEAAAHVGRDDPHVRLIEPEELREPGADEMRHLGGRVHDELSLALVVTGEHRLALQRRHALACGAVLALDNDRGALPDRLDVAVDRGFQEEVVVPFVMHARSVGAAGGEAVGDRGQCFELELHRFGDILGLGPGRGDAERHALAGEAHLVAGERRIVGRLVPGQARLGPDRSHAFHVLGCEHPAGVALGDGDRPDAGVRKRTAHERHLPQPGEGEVAHELRLAGQMSGVFLARDASPDPRRHVCYLPKCLVREYCAVFVVAFGPGWDIVFGAPRERCVGLGFVERFTEPAHRTVQMLETELCSAIDGSVTASLQRTALGARDHETVLRVACAVGSNSRASPPMDSFGSKPSGLRPARTGSTLWRRNVDGYGGLVLSNFGRQVKRHSPWWQGGSVPAE